MNMLKTITLALLLVTSSLVGLRAEEVSPNDIDDATLIQYALQLRETKSELFAGAQGVLVLAIAPGSQAKKKGLLRGDIIIAYNGQPVKSAAQLFSTIQANAAKPQIELQFFRAEIIKVVVLQGGQIGINLANIKKIDQMTLLERLEKEIEQAYHAANYVTALKKLKNGLQQASISNDKYYISQFLINLGHVYQIFKQYQKALEHYQQALVIFREINDQRGESAVIYNIGLVYENLYQYQKSSDHYQQALAIYQNLGNKSRQAYILNSIATNYDRVGQYAKALEYYQQSLTLCRTIKNKQEESNNLTDIGVVYGHIGQYQKSIKYFKQALTIHQNIADKHGMGYDFNNIGTAYHKLGKRKKSLEYYKQALTIFNDIGDRSGVEKTNINIVMVKFELERSPNLFEYVDQTEEALKSLEESLAFAKEANDKYLISRILFKMGLFFLAQSRYRTSLTYFEEALTIQGEIADKIGQIMTMARIGYVKAFFKKYESAIQHYEQAIDNLEKLRYRLKEKEHQLYFQQNKLHIYDEFIALLQSLHLNDPTKGYDRKAIEIFERKQGRVSLEEIGQSGAWRFAGVPKETSEKDRYLTRQIAETRKNYTEALNQGKDSKPHYHKLKNLQVKQAIFEKELQKNYPAYYALKYPKPVALKSLQNGVLQANEFLLIYNVRKETTDLWIINKHQFQMFTLELSEEELKAKVKAFLAGPNSLIEAIKTLPYWEISDLAEENLPAIHQASYDLYRLLIPEKAKTLLKDARTLYIVPTGPLYGLPFGALDTHNPDQHKRPHYFIQDYPIAYLSSASLLKTIRDTERKKSDRYPFLAFADPIYPQTCSLKSADATQAIQAARTQAYLKLAGSETEGCFKKLPETGKQAQEIQQLLQAPLNTKPLQLRDKASRSNVFKFSNNKRLDDYQYVLFAAHAVLPNEITHINQPAIVLSNPDTEGYLTMADAFALDMNADFVMLSACNTGRGKNIRGEGVRGLTRAFMYAGTPAVSVSLWSVESRSTKALSINLFKYLQAGKSLAQALRQSKLDLMADEDRDMYQHPYFWAPFVVFGDGN